MLKGHRGEAQAKTRLWIFSSLLIGWPWDRESLVDYRGAGEWSRVITRLMINERGEVGTSASERWDVGKGGVGTSSLQQGKYTFKMEIVVDADCHFLPRVVCLECQLQAAPYTPVASCAVSLPVGPLWLLLCAGSARGAGRKCWDVQCPQGQPSTQTGWGLVDRCPHSCPRGGAVWRACWTVALSPGCPAWLPFINLRFIGSCSFSESPVYSPMMLPGISCLHPNPCLWLCF